MFRSTKRLPRLFAVVAAAAVLVQGCGSGHGSGDAREHEPTAAVPLDQLFTSTEYRYAAMEHPSDLLNGFVPSVGVLGTVEGFTRGPQYATSERDGDDTGVHSNLMQVKVSEFYPGADPVRGAESVRAGSTVTVLLAGGPEDVEVLAKSIPPDTRVLFYIHPNRDPNTDKNLWVPTTPQGFIVEAFEGDGVVYPADPEADGDDSIESLTPEGAKS